MTSWVERFMLGSSVWIQAPIVLISLVIFSAILSGIFTWLMFKAIPLSGVERRQFTTPSFEESSDDVVDTNMNSQASAKVDISVKGWKMFKNSQVHRILIAMIGLLILIAVLRLLFG